MDYHFPDRKRRTIKCTGWSMTCLGRRARGLSLCWQWSRAHLSSDLVRYCLQQVVGSLSFDLFRPSFGLQALPWPLPETRRHHQRVCRFWLVFQVDCNIILKIVCNTDQSGLLQRTRMRQQQLQSVVVQLWLFKLANRMETNIMLSSTSTVTVTPNMDKLEKQQSNISWKKY